MAGRAMGRWLGLAAICNAVACGDEDEPSDSSADAAGTVAITSGDGDGATSSSGTLDCANVEIEGCTMVVEVCEGGDCSCVCADTGDTTATGDDGACPPVLPAGACEVSCEATAASCGTADVCCGCEPHEGSAMFWVCSGESSAGCPATLPAIGDPCDAAMQCWYCDPAFAFRGCDGTLWSAVTEWTCPG